MATRRLTVEVVGDARKLGRTFDDTERKTRGLAKVGGLLAGAFSGVAVAAGIKSIADAGSDLNETTNKLGLAFGRNAEAIQAWAQGSAKSMGLPKQAALESVSSFGLLFSKIGVGAGESAKMSKSMVQLAVDLGSVHNADPTQVIEAQTAAFRGEYDSLQKFVPAISAATVQTEALRQTGKDNAKQLTDSEKAQAVYSIMLKQTTKEQGDFARTSGDAANQTKINAARMKDLQANLGTLLLPVLNSVVGALGATADWMENNRGAAAALGGAVAVVTGLIVANTVATKAKVAWDTAWAAGSKIVTAAQWALNVALRANPIGLVITAIVLLAAGLVYAYKHSATFRRIVDGAFRAVASAAKFMWENVLRPVFSFLVRTWLTVAGTIVRGAVLAFGWVPGVGPKLKTAAAKFHEFAGSVNRSLNAIDDEGVNVKLRSTFTPPKGFSMHSIVGQKGLRLPGYGGGDIVPAMLEPGEAVVPKEAVRAPGFAAWAATMGIPGFQRGGLVPTVSLFSPAQMERTQERIDARVAAKTAAGIARNYQLLLLGGFGGIGGAGGGGTVGAAANAWRTFAHLFGLPMGGRAPRSNPSDHPIGKAIDIMTGNRAMHRAIIAVGQQLPGAKYWISYRQIGHARDGFSPRYYGGPSPHTDHVHWSFYDRGGWLPPGLSLAYNGTGRPERVSPPGGGGDIHVHLHGPVYGDRQALVREVRDGIKQARRLEGRDPATV